MKNSGGSRAPGPLKLSKTRFNSIVAARGVAALIVVAHHAGAIVAEQRFFGEHAFDGVLTRFTGVSFFFVLSGFFIGWINWKEIGGQARAWEFCKKRLAKLYPAYWFVLIPLIILYAVIPNAVDPSKRDPINAILSFFLLPQPHQPVYGVAWTLVHEVLFCVVFTLIIWRGKSAIWILPAWALAIFLLQVPEGELAFPASFFFSASNFQFLTGIAVARFLRHWEPPAPAILLPLGALIYLGFMVWGASITSDYFWERFIFAIGGGLIIAGAVGVEHRKGFSIPSFFLLLGNASFGIYLIHPIALSFATRVVSRLPVHGLPVELIVIALVCVSASAGVAFYFLVEPKIVDLTKRCLDFSSTAFHGKSRELRVAKPRG